MLPVRAQLLTAAVTGAASGALTGSLLCPAGNTAGLPCFIHDQGLSLVRDRCIPIETVPDGLHKRSNSSCIVPAQLLRRSSCRISLAHICVFVSALTLFIIRLTFSWSPKNSALSGPHDMGVARGIRSAQRKRYSMGEHDGMSMSTMTSSDNLSSILASARTTLPCVTTSTFLPCLICSAISFQHGRTRSRVSLRLSVRGRSPSWKPMCAYFVSCPGQHG
mmetsp:Transcript_32637/g.63772  ORF Transcript_32637/g.63772 Transcript_32637/m.63772 type:complete len:220 (-) Transcript_32637:631-1290(-)